MDDHIECIARTPAFITLKDHILSTKLVVLIINPAKGKLGKVDKLIIKKNK